jgi:hypothetical protein
MHRVIESAGNQDTQALIKMEASKSAPGPQKVQKVAQAITVGTKQG